MGKAARKIIVRWDASDLYGVLGIARNASAEEILAGYRRASSKYHPDKCRDDDAVDKFKRVQLAFEILSDSERRAHYDASGEVGESKADNARNQVYGMLASVLEQVIGGINGDPTGYDIVKMMRNHLNTSLGNARAALPKLEQQVAKLERTAKRMKCKTGNNFLAGMILSPIRDIKSQQENTLKQITMMEQGLALLEDFFYEVDETFVKKEVNVMWGTMSGATFTFGGK